MLSPEVIKCLGEQAKKLDAILDIIKNEPLENKMTIISMVIDTTARTHNMPCIELWSVMFNVALHVYECCGEMEDEK